VTTLSVYQRIALFALVVCTLVTACGDPRFKKTYPVRGKVLFEGQPAAGAAIRLQAIEVEDHPWTKPSAQVTESGEFTLSTYKSGDGAPAGKYQVAIIWLPPGYNGPLESANKLPARYADPETSGLVVVINRGDNDLPTFELTK
jgi:hypothetical protein